MHSFSKAAKWRVVLFSPSSAVGGLSVRVHQVSVDSERGVFQEPSEQWMSYVEFFVENVRTSLILAS